MKYLRSKDLITVLFCAYIIIILKVEAQVQTPADRLYGDIGLSDGPATPPYNSTEPVIVHLGFRLQHIYSVQEESALHTNVELIQKWYDWRLTWKPEDYDGITQLIVNAKNLWTPDIIVQNSVLDTALRFNNFFGEESEQVVLEYTGLVTRKPSYLLKTICQFDFKYFPHDAHKCPFIIRSVLHDTSVLGLYTELFPDAQRVFVDTVGNYAAHSSSTIYHETNEWQLSFMTSRHAFTVDADYKVFDISLVEIVISRESSVYSGNILNPFYYLLMVTLFSVFLPPQSGERISILMAVLLSYTVLCLVVTDSLPKNSKEEPMITTLLTRAMNYNVCLLAWYCIFLGLYDIQSTAFYKKCRQILNQKPRQRPNQVQQTPDKDDTPVQELQPGQYPNMNLDQGCNAESDLTPVIYLEPEHHQEIDLGQGPNAVRDQTNNADGVLHKTQQEQSKTEDQVKPGNDNCCSSCWKIFSWIWNLLICCKTVEQLNQGNENSDFNRWKRFLWILNVVLCGIFCGYNAYLLFDLYVKLPKEQQKQIDNWKLAYDRSELIDYTETYG